jgi:hypothetical protein
MSWLVDDLWRKSGLVARCGCQPAAGGQMRPIAARCAAVLRVDPLALFGGGSVGGMFGFALALAVGGLAVFLRGVEARAAGLFLGWVRLFLDWVRYGRFSLWIVAGYFCRALGGWYCHAREREEAGCEVAEFDDVEVCGCAADAGDEGGCGEALAVIEHGRWAVARYRSVWDLAPRGRFGEEDKVRLAARPEFHSVERERRIQRLKRGGRHVGGRKPPVSLAKVNLE